MIGKVAIIVGILQYTFLGLSISVLEWDPLLELSIIMLLGLIGFCCAMIWFRDSVEVKAQYNANVSEVNNGS